MGFASWVKDARERETEQVDDVTKKYYRGVRPAFRIALLLSKTRGYWLHFNLVYGFMVYTNVLLTMGLFIFSVSKYGDDLDTMIITCHHTVIGAFGITMSMCFIAKRRPYVSMLEMMQTRLYEYKGDPALHPTKDTSLKMAEWFVHKLMAFFPILIVGFVFGVKRLFTTVFPSEISVTETGINYLVAHPMYCPTEGFSAVFYVCELMEGFFALQSASSIASTASMYMVHSMFVISELDYLFLSVSNFENRVKIRLKKMKTKKIRLTKEKMHECATECLVENIKHHHLIWKYFSHLNDMMSLILFIAYATGTFTMGLAMVKLFTTKADQKVDIGNTTLIGMLFVFEIVFMLVVSFFGEMIVTKSHLVFDELRFMPLDKFSGIKFRKTLLMFTMGMRKPMALDAAGFNKCNMETFASVINVAYSMLNIAAAAKSD